MKYKIVTDSSANLTDAWAAEALSAAGFASVPLKIRSSVREFTDDDGLDVGEMVEVLRSAKGPSGSSCPNMSEWLSAIGDAEWAFLYTISRNLSGSYAAAVQAARDYTERYPDRRVYVFDTLSTGPEMQLLIEKTEEMLRAGCDFSEIVEGVEAYGKTTHLIFSLESLRNLAANGRVKPAVAALAGVLGIRVLAAASEEGTIEMRKKVRGERAMLRAMPDLMAEGGYFGGKVRIAHCFNEDAARALAEGIRESYPGADVEILVCRGLCSFYAERGGVLVGFEGA